MEKEYVHPYTGKYVVVRTYASGVHFGYLKEYDPQTRHIYLTEDRILHFWSGAFTLNAVAMNGVEDARIPLAVPEIMLSDVLSIIRCEEKAEEILKNFPEHKP